MLCFRRATGVTANLYIGGGKVGGAGGVPGAGGGGKKSGGGGLMSAVVTAVLRAMGVLSVVSEGLSFEAKLK